MEDVLELYAEPHDPALDDISRLAAQVCNAPVAANSAAIIASAFLRRNRDDCAYPYAKLTA